MNTSLKEGEGGIIYRELVYRGRLIYGGGDSST